MNAKWPRLANGAVDWSQAFLHPEDGLMANVERADSSEKLQACMHVIIAALFSRDDDADLRRSFVASIDQLFPPGGGRLVAQKAKSKLLLGRIMYDREDRARQYADAKAASKHDEAEQRLKQDDPLLALSEISDETYL